ncbi:DUF6887 family protein [Brasilonema bromeliae]|uniref:Uncharacterized protein n=1 Tax=Brasilonema bromeliae SPC951 TaxID=385972 RepID=A0ABX1P3G0_9CYAN|nr:hypothetical protein [Brasilonema bromeliae]NMG18491.1 hypothetical protein [Brasilonema bromeliae SPC951]
MSQIDYAAMSNQQLKQYMLEHRDDEAALKAYLDRRHQRSTVIITTVNDPDFDAKVQAAIRQQMSDSG